MLGRRRGYTLPWGAAGYARAVPLAGADPSGTWAEGPTGRQGRRAAAAAWASVITCRVTTAPDGKLDAETFTADGRPLVCWLGLDLRPVALPVSGPAQGLIDALAALQEPAA